MHFNLPFTVAMATCASLVTAAGGGKAPKVKKNPADVVGFADLPIGNVLFTAKNGGTVSVFVDITNLPATGGPFHYHIHEDKVVDGECEAAGEDFNPYNAPLDKPCDELKDDSYCRVGDLSGKHGWINATCYDTHYSDPYLSLNKKSKAYIIGRSISFHFSNGTKFACANIEKVATDQLSKLVSEYHYEEFLSQDYADLEFDEDSALEQEYFDYESEGRSKTELSQMIGDDCGDDHKNTTNSSYSSVQVPSSSTSEYENASPLLNVGLGMGVAGLVGLLI